MAPNVVPVPAGDDPVELLRRCEPVIRFSDLIGAPVDSNATTATTLAPVGGGGKSGGGSRRVLSEMLGFGGFRGVAVVTEPALTPDTA